MGEDLREIMPTDPRSDLLAEPPLQRIEDGTVIKGHAAARLMPGVPCMIGDQPFPATISLGVPRGVHQSGARPAEALKPSGAAKR